MADDDNVTPLDQQLQYYSLSHCHGMEQDEDRELAATLPASWWDDGQLLGVRSIAAHAVDNINRSTRAAAVTEFYKKLFYDGLPDEDSKSLLRDLLTDLRHYCAAEDDDFDKALLTSEINFEEEKHV